MSALKVRPPFLTSLYNHNPFYAISTVLMLFAVRNAYGELTIGAINCWIMMGVLAAYTALLAAEQSLTSRGGLLGFFHDYLRRAVRDRYLTSETDRRHPEYEEHDTTK